MSTNQIQPSPLKVEATESCFTIFPPGADKSGLLLSLPWSCLESLRHELHILRNPADVAATQKVVIPDLPPFPGEKFAGKDYKVDDYIRLVVRDRNNIEAERYLQRWGRWFKASSGAKGGTQWLLKTIGNQPRELPKTKVDLKTIFKQNDPDYVVVGVGKFPAEFDYKLFEGIYKAEQAKL